jgi:hypothetical protein
VVTDGVRRAVEAVADLLVGGTARVVVIAEIVGGEQRLLLSVTEGRDRVSRRVSNSPTSWTARVTGGGISSNIVWSAAAGPTIRTWALSSR